MERYDYLEAVKADVLDYIRNEIDLTEWRGDRDGLEHQLNDDLFVSDSVTGNASGSYTLNTWESEEYIAHNWDLLAEAIDELGENADILRLGAECCDVTIRCYLLGKAIGEILDNLEMDGEFEEEEKD